MKNFVFDSWRNNRLLRRHLFVVSGSELCLFSIGHACKQLFNSLIPSTVHRAVVHWEETYTSIYHREQFVFIECEE